MVALLVVGEERFVMEGAKEEASIANGRFVVCCVMMIYFVASKLMNLYCVEK